MTWARFDDQMAFHAKVLAAGNEAVGAWARMIAHCCAHLTDGKVARSVALSITTPKVLARLVAAGLLEADVDDFAVHDFLDWNPPAEEVKAKRNADRIRKDSARNRQGRGADGRIKSATCPPGQHAAVQTESEIRPPVPSPVSRLPSPITDPPNPLSENQPDAPDPDSGTRPRTTTPDPQGDYDIGEAWAAGTTAGSGCPMAVPRGGALKTLLDTLAAHGPARKGPSGSSNVARFAKETGALYGAFAASQKRSVFAYGDFMNSGRYREQAEEPPLVLEKFEKPRPKTPEELRELAESGERLLRELDGLKSA